MVFNATFNNIFELSHGSQFFGWGNQSTRRKPTTCHKSLTNFITQSIVYTSPWTGFKLTTLVAIATDCTGSCKSNYHTIMTITAPLSDGTIVVYIFLSDETILTYICHDLLSVLWWRACDYPFGICKLFILS